MPGLPARYVQFTEAVEERLPDEEGIIDELVATFIRMAETTADHYRHAVRPSHAKSHGLLKGELSVYPGLPEPYAQGLFAAPRTYPVLIRFASVPAEILADSVHTQRGMAIKVLGAEGETIPQHEEGATTQDFLLDDGTSTFPVPNAAAFLAQMKGIAKTTDKVEPLKKVVSATARGANAVLSAVGLDSANLDFLGHPPKHILADTFFSQSPIRYGSCIAKVSAAPLSPNLKALEGVEHDVHGEFSAVRDDVVNFFRGEGAEYEFRVQLCTDLDRMPVEDSSVEWPEDESPHVPVARITVPPQDAYSPARRVYFDDVLSFSPAHALAAHRPLGSIMRARLVAYPTLSRFRHEMNAQPRREPRGIEEAPD